MEEQQQQAKEKKRELANQHRAEKESKNRTASSGKSKSVTERIINDELDDYRPEPPTPQAKATGRPTRGGYEKVLGHTSIPDPIDDDLVNEESEKSVRQAKEEPAKAGTDIRKE